MYYLQKTSDGKNQIVFARVNQALVLKVCIPTSSKQAKLMLPEINFILFTSFERDYATPQAFTKKEIISINEEEFIGYFGNSIDVIFKQLNVNLRDKKNVQKRA